MWKGREPRGSVPLAVLPHTQRSTEAAAFWRLCVPSSLSGEIDRSVVRCSLEEQCVLVLRHARVAIGHNAVAAVSPCVNMPLGLVSSP